jgi:hypothetical protein
MKTQIAFITNADVSEESTCKALKQSVSCALRLGITCVFRNSDEVRNTDITNRTKNQGGIPFLSSET